MEIISTVKENDTIVLMPGRNSIDHYAGMMGRGFTYDFFMLDGMGPHPIEKDSRLTVYRDKDGVFDAFEWGPLTGPEFY